jgi:hypothetical protein
LCVCGLFGNWETIISFVKLTIKELKQIVQEAWWEETYDKLLMDDPAIEADTLIVPKSSKEKIKKWAKAMKLA